MKYIKSLHIAIVLLLLAACQTEQWEGLGGGFVVSLGEDVTVSTKSTPAELGKPDAGLFHLKIVKEDTGNTQYDGSFTDKTIPASAGLYTLTATCGDNPVLGLDTPYYQGEESSVEVTEGETTSVELKCSVANALTSVIFEEPEKFDALYSSYGLKIVVGNQSVTLSPSLAKKSVYYRAGTIPVFQFVGTLKDNGQEVSTTLDNDTLKKAATFAAGKHCKLTLKVKPTESGVILTVSKVEVEMVSISETIPVEWLPKPKITAEGFEGNTLTFAETESKTASIKLNTSSALQDMKFKFNFADERFAAFNQEYQLATLSEENRTKIETELGISLPLIGDTSPTILLDNLIARLQTNAGETTNNTIKMDVLANNRWSSEDETANRRYTLQCNKPEFSVSVDATNCWSREFTINEITVTTGNKEVIENNLVYQYYDGTNWIECSTREAEKGRTQQFQEAANDITTKTYRVRALYRGAIASAEAEATLETPEQLPNSGMEEWNYEIYTKSLYCFYPWQDKGDCHWDTNNIYTTRHRHNSSDAVIQNYNGFHAVSYVTGRDNKGLAAELRSTANGRGNTDDFLFVKHNEKDQNKVAGELFLGDCKLNLTGNDIDGNDTYEREKNAIFTNRPTALKFWYKYTPYTSDTWSVHIELLNENKNIIIQTDYTSSESVFTWAEQTVTLNYAEETPYEKCKYIYVIFSSTTNAGANMPYREITQTFYVDGQENTFNPAYIGSVLTIDDISLIYDK
ncbi:DUF4493 domain-containing protein [Mediterranea massiliensis]|uniref:DUF4493 domain-containing protein n=1 Tax=Mediterranea massiliensis TaxID=1841865 RepID=UPI0025A4383E|nr:DUF4493 domain-containing protein [Mediterranea massiliensis]MDM8337183.1 DUF4493 domain-containing protein [Mediterranea massiliensis]